MKGLFITVLNMSLTANYVILCVMLIRFLLKKTPKTISYALWSVVAFRLICPFSFESMFSLLPKNTAIMSQDIVYQLNSPISNNIAEIDSFANEILPAPAMEASVNPMQIYTQIGSYIWGAGVAALLAYSIVSTLVLKRRLVNAQYIEHNIYEADNLKTPFVLGILRPKVFIPTGLDVGEKDCIILHEQTHIRRFDHIIKPFAFLVVSIHWFNPLVWIAFLLMSTDMELSCDEKVIKDMGSTAKKPYAASLLSLATDRRILNGSPLAFGEGNVKSRIINVLNYKKPAFWVTVFAVIIAAGVGVGLITNPKSINSDEDSDAPIKHIQIEVIKPGSRLLTGRVITDKDGYQAGDIVSVAFSEKVTYEVASLEVGDWIDIDYKVVKQKNPPQFEAIRLNNITGEDYPTTFTLVENGDIIKSNTLRNSRIATELPSLILSGSSETSLRIDDIPDSSRYLKIDIGFLGDKIYYTFEKEGRCYIGQDDMHEISRETFNELMQYVYKNEITDKRAAGADTDKKESSDQPVMNNTIQEKDEFFWERPSDNGIIPFPGYLRKVQLKMQHEIEIRDLIVNEDIFLICLPLYLKLRK